MILVSIFSGEDQGKIEEIGVDKELKRELITETKTVESQLLSPSPKQIILKESLSTIKNILEGATGSIAAAMLIKLAPVLSFLR